MTIGERMKQRRKEKKISVEYLAKELGVSCSTVYRYEDTSIEKIPVKVFDRLCTILEMTPAELLGNESGKPKQEIPAQFDNPRDAMEFILKTPTLAAFGGYDPESMGEETIVEFANEILRQLEIVSYKYRK